MLQGQKAAWQMWRCPMKIRAAENHALVTVLMLVFPILAWLHPGCWNIIQVAGTLPRLRRTVDGRYPKQPPGINGINYLSTGAGFLSSAVFMSLRYQNLSLCAAVDNTTNIKHDDDDDDDTKLESRLHTGFVFCFFHEFHSGRLRTGWRIYTTR